jgi:hypothetical protein
MRGDGSRPRLRTTRRARRQSGNSQSGEKREEERRQEAKGLGAEDEERPLFLPTPSFMASAEEE